MCTIMSGERGSTKMSSAPKIYLQRMAADEDCQWRACLVLGAEVCAHAGTHKVADARGHRCESG